MFWLTIFAPITIILASFVILVSYFVPISWAPRLRKVARLWGKVSLWLSLSKVEVRGHNNIARSPLVLISNHQSSYDIYIALGYYPFDFLFFSKKEMFQVPFVGQSMKKLDYISVDRHNARAAARSLIQSVKKIKAGNNVLIYPEGTRGPTPDNFNSFKPGTMLVARQGAIPIQPIVVYGAQNIRPLKNKFQIFPGKIVVEILPAINSDHNWHPANKNSELSEKEKLAGLRDHMMQAYKSIESSLK